MIHEKAIKLDELPYTFLVAPKQLREVSITFSNAKRAVLESQGLFPKRRKLGARTIRYVAGELRDYLNAIAESRDYNGGAR